MKSTLRFALVSRLCLFALLGSWLLGSAHAQSAHQLFAFDCTVSGSKHDLTTTCPMGSGPDSLLQSADGNFYGATGTGGTGNQAAGTIFKLTLGGQLTTLYTFVADSSGNFPSGAGPGGLIEGNDGFLYGATVSGGANNSGVMFKISKMGTFKVLRNADAGGFGALTLGSDGNFYGCGAGYLNTGVGGSLFRLTPSGSYTLLHTFEVRTEGIQCLGMTLASDGNMYGTMSGGSVKITTLFRLTPGGEFTILHTFHYGQFTVTAPLQSENGNVYGGLDFVELPNVPFVPGIFVSELSGANYEQIALPYGVEQSVGDLAEYSDGNFWGTSSAIGPQGSIVSFSHAGKPLRQIGFAPFLMMQLSNGLLAGVAGGGSVPAGHVSGGMIFTMNAALSAPKPLFVRTSLVNGKAGASVVIEGSHLLGTKSVTFNGVSASFKVLNTGNILATVPAGATTGRISVTNAGGSGESADNFTIE